MKDEPRLKRLLLLVPYIIEHKGVTTSELCEKFDVTEDVLISDLDLLTLCGLPDYTPDMLIDYRIEGGRVCVDCPGHLDRPMRFTIGEALALYLASQVLGAGSTSLRSAMGKVREALGSEEDKLQSVLKQFSMEAPAQAPLKEQLERALEDRATVEIDYLGEGSGQAATRQVDPHLVLAASGRWYLVGYCHKAEAMRSFRMDRIRSLQETARTFTPRPLDGSVHHPGQAYAQAPGDDIVRLEFSAALKQWVEERWPDRIERMEEDGRSVVTFHTSKHEWVIKRLLEHGIEARVLETESLKSALLATVARLKKVYSG